MNPIPYAFDFEEIPGWPRLTGDIALYDVTGVAIDSHDEVYITGRDTHKVLVFDLDGGFQRAWTGSGMKTPHGIFIDRDDRIYIADDADHTVKVFDRLGELQLTLGRSGSPSDTGFDLGKSPVLRSAAPFNRVTNVAVTSGGDIVVADGYGNAAVHRFSRDGDLIRSWGRPGSGPGEFRVVHGIGVDSQDRVYVCDRENSRVQIFSIDGDFLASWDWLNRPQDIYVDGNDHLFISESGWCKPLASSVHIPAMLQPPPGHDPLARVSVCDTSGCILARVGGPNPVASGGLIAPHGVWCDRHGDLYVVEAVHISRADKYFQPHYCAPFKKFRRREGAGQSPSLAQVPSMPARH